MTKEAMKLALEALERSVATCFDQYAHRQVMSQPDHFINQAIASIKEALREHALKEVQRLGQEIEQEPVTTLEDLEQEIYENTRQFVSHDVMEWMLKRYYTTPPQREWQGLTDEEINDHWINAMWNTEGTRLPIPEFARAIEAKLKEKNT